MDHVRLMKKRTCPTIRIGKSQEMDLAQAYHRLQGPQNLGLKLRPQSHPQLLPILTPTQVINKPSSSHDLI